MINSIKIEKLFGYKDTIDIKFDKSLTILIGANGSGKTTILNIVNNIMNRTYLNLLKYKFEYIKVSYDDLNSVIIRKNNKIYIINEEYDVTDLLEKEEEELLKIDDITVINRDEESEEEDGIITIREERIPYSTLYFPTYRRSEVELTEFIRSQLYDRGFYYSRTRNLYKFENTVVGINNKDIEEIVKRKWIEVSDNESSILNSFISEMFLSFLKIKRDSDDLLDSTDPEEIEEKITEIFVRTKLIRNSSNVDTKISTYTENIKKAKEIKIDVTDALEGKELNLKKLDNMLEQVEERRVVSYSLSKILDIINLYDEKCKNIENIKLPFKKLEETLNEFLYPKITRVNNGILSFEENRTKLNFEDLSAGEKQLITIFSYICLGVKKNGTVIIDEPEISLHINWQRMIIKKLIENRPDIQFIISTHSPNVLVNHRNSKVRIGEASYE